MKKTIGIIGAVLIAAGGIGYYLALD